MTTHPEDLLGVSDTADEAFAAALAGDGPRGGYTPEQVDQILHNTKGPHGIDAADMPADDTTRRDDLTEDVLSALAAARLNFDRRLRARGERVPLRSLETVFGFAMHELARADLSDDDDFRTVREMVANHAADLLTWCAKESRKRGTEL